MNVYDYDFRGRRGSSGEVSVEKPTMTAEETFNVTVNMGGKKINVPMTRAEVDMEIAKIKKTLDNLKIVVSDEHTHYIADGYFLCRTHYGYRQRGDFSPATTKVTCSKCVKALAKFQGDLKFFENLLKLSGLHGLGTSKFNRNVFDKSRLTFVGSKKLFRSGNRCRSIGLCDLFSRGRSGRHLSI